MKTIVLTKLIPLKFNDNGFSQTEINIKEFDIELGKNYRIDEKSKSITISKDTLYISYVANEIASPVPPVADG